jgi:hypothetical protein
VGINWKWQEVSIRYVIIQTVNEYE